MHYKNSIIPVTDGMDRSSFPDNFSNEVYRSKTKSFGHVSYNSCFSIKYLIQGENNYVVDNSLHVVKAGSILIINDGAHVECSAHKAEEGLSLFLDGELLADIHSNQTSSNTSLIDDPHQASQVIPHFYDKVLLKEANTELRTWLDRLISQHNIENDLMLTADFYYNLGELLITAHGDIQSKVESINKARLSTRKEIFSRIQSVKEYLDDSVSGKFDLESLSKEVALSKFHLIRCYKEVYKTTPQKYFIHKKIELAKKLLRSHGVSEVAQMLSYRDIHSFSRQFKLTTGLPPSRFNH